MVRRDPTCVVILSSSDIELGDMRISAAYIALITVTAYTGFTTAGLVTRSLCHTACDVGIAMCRGQVAPVAGKSDLFVHCASS
jgi:hypothetical protein